MQLKQTEFQAKRAKRHEDYQKSVKAKQFKQNQFSANDFNHHDVD